MCGISGIIKKQGTINPDELRAMNDCVQHRGPDAEGFYIKHGVGFGHRRLAIIELSELGAQPMTYSDNYTITYNGEVYNYIEIREMLARKGYAFTGGSDTEVILAAYQEYGPECVRFFNGMWALAIHDVKNNTVFISRDRFGVKPLYYFEDDNSFYFSSEIRQLLPFLKERKVNRQVLFDYLYLGYHHHTSETFFEGITSLDGGHNMIIDLSSGARQITQWYELKVNKDFRNLSFIEAQRLFEETLDQAIRLRLRSDVKVGTCLSGGLDSSYIATVAAASYNKIANGKFTAITAKSVQSSNDESRYAEIVAAKADLNWRITYPQPEDFLRVVEEVVEVQEEPFGSPSILMQYFVMKKAGEEGCTVLLDGQGGDEALLGYDRYFAAYLIQQKGLINKYRAYRDIARNSKLNLTEVFLYSLYFNSHNVRAIRQMKRMKFVKSEFKKMLNLDLLKSISAAGKDITELQIHEITRVQLQKLLKYEDRNSMRFSIETRVPFVDFNVIELAISLPFSYKVKEGWSKFILRKTAEKKLPAEIVWRKDKIGFEAPKNWFDNKETILQSIRQSDFLQDFVHLEKIRHDTEDTSLWRLFNLALWARKFKVLF